MDLDRDNMCFACGNDNPASLKLDFELIRSCQVEAVFVPDKIYQGYQGIMHGGITCTLLDEAMAKVINMNGIKALTASLNTRFVQPVEIGEKLYIRGYLKEKKGKIIITEADIKDSEGKTLARAEAKFVKIKTEEGN